MENLDVIVLQTLKTWRAAGRQALLATVIRTWGSSPRPEGSIMALSEDGAVVGSVSGGCIEDDLIRQFSRSRAGEFPGGPPRRLTYGVTADEAHRFGLPCGGTLELLLEFNPELSQLELLLDALSKGSLVQRRTLLTTGAVTLDVAEQPKCIRLTDTHLVNTFGPQFRMLIIGAGQLSEYLATMANFCGFAVTVCDPRQEYRTSWSVPNVSLLRDWPDDVVKAFRPDRRSCVLALTHDPKLDDLALLEAIETDAFYVGAIGSRRNNRQRRERLVEHFDQTEASVARLRGPIGIYIGSKTPAEIAVSVMAEVLAVKNDVLLPRDMDVANAKERLVRTPDQQTV
jgi:xanthine dehydrogenase accessory factor